MKKTYQNPVIKVVKIQTLQMMAASPQTIGFGASVTSASGAESRRFGGDFLDDEEY